MVRLDQFDKYVRPLQRLFIRRVHFIDGMPWQDLLTKENKGLIVLNHGPIIGPFVWIIAVLPRIVDMGYGHLKYSAIAHPIIRNVPFFAKMVGFEKRGGKRLGVDDYVRLFDNDELNLVSVTPEGEFSLYGNGVDMQPFRSPRGLEIALRARTRIILMVGKGFESWQTNVPIDKPWQKRMVRWFARRIPFLDRLDEEALGQATKLSISRIFGRIPDFYVSSEMYEPELKLEDLSEDRETSRKQLWEEAERMRQRMIAMLDEM